MNRLRRILADRRLRFALIVLIVGATLAVFIQYLIANPKVLSIVAGLHPAALTLLALAYCGTIVANAIVLSASLRLIGKRVGFTENLSLTGYSSIVNFFGPLQSGPGFRAAYLKQRHGVSLKKFLYTTLLFYAFFALINGLVIAVAIAVNLPSSFTVPVVSAGVILLAAAAWLSYRFIPAVRTAIGMVKLRSPYFWIVGLGALLLSLCTTAAYFLELIHVDVSIGFMQAVVYAAAANLALFVSLTPGAIGFRESFLLLSENLHQIPTDTVIAASIIDRAFYVVFLLALFGLLLAFGVKSRLVRQNARK
jgi:uncharacterized membrane protein YbhN (UPF0104 family)